MRGFLVFLGVLFVLSGGALAGAQFAPVDLSMLDAVAGAKEFVASAMALYAGGGAAGFGLLLIIIAAATGGGKKEKSTSVATPAQAAAAETGKPEHAPASETPVTRTAPAEARASLVQSKPQPVLQPATAGAAPKPTASAQPPWSSPGDPPGAPPSDPRLLNRKRVSDLVSINDALKAYHALNNAYPKAADLAGFCERGAAWIPGLAPDFIATLPRDPVQASDMSGPQYVYVSDGKDYKLLAHGVSLLGGTNVEVLGVRIDPTRNPTAKNASFGFWSPGFASA